MTIGTERSLRGWIRKGKATIFLFEQVNKWRFQSPLEQRRVGVRDTQQQHPIEQLVLEKLINHFEKDCIKCFAEIMKCCISLTFIKSFGNI
jgi:sigma54-dependent transcription regulator